MFLLKRSSILFFIFFFVIVSCNNDQEVDLNLQHLDYIAENINDDLIEIKTNILNLGNEIGYKVPFEKEVVWDLEKKYHRHQGEILFSSFEKNHSAVYFPADKELTKQLQKTIINTEQLDTVFNLIVKRNPSLSQIYFLDTSSFLRIYPYINVINYLKSSVDLTKLVSFQTAQNKQFEDNHAYWVNKPFADPFGRGWIISCVEPVYFRDNFIGIVCGDIRLHSIKTRYFSSNTEIIMIIDDKGGIICSTRQASKLVNVPQCRDFQYFKPVTEDIYMFNTPSLLDHKNTDLSKAIESLLSGKNKDVFYIDKEKYTIYKSVIRETNWFLLKIIN
jgi:hypothetical protein